MDPFSIAVGAITLLGVSKKLIEILRNIKRGVVSIDKDLEALTNDASAILSATRVLQDLWEAQVEHRQRLVDFKQHESFHVWESVSTLLPRCEETIVNIQSLLQEVGVISWSRTPKRLEGFVKFMKNHSREDEYLSLRRNLSGYQATLQMLLSAIQVSLAWNGLASQDDLADDMNMRFAELNERIDIFRPILESKTGSTLRGAFNSARTVASLASRNQYFDIPQPVSSIFTGRQTLLQKLETIMFGEALEPDVNASSDRQKRFVIYGLGGSGKTQFCCKFAQDNRQKFWAIFWIDASSEDSIRRTLAKIGSIVRVEPNDRAAKNWLSILEKPWLLIIDNANDNQFELENHFPSGERGHLLITTTNPSHRIYGTVGEKCFDFSTLEVQDATSLLLKAADEPMPWTSSSEEAASQITRTLGYLPLALIVAGKTIVKGLCTLGTYLSFYESNWKKMRNQAGRKNSLKTFLTGRNHHKSIYISCEMMHRSLQTENTQASSDAIELLNIFSFLHRESIPFDLFLQGAMNPKLEAEEDKRNMNTEKHQQAQPWTIFDLFSAIKAWLYLRAAGGIRVLPGVLRLPHQKQDEYDEWRLREALSELTQRSLIMYNPDKDHYSMHPIIHTWIRERPQMTTADQAVWSEITATLLSQAILLPPLATGDADEKFRRDLLPHVIHLRKCKIRIDQQFKKNQEERKSVWPVLIPMMTRTEALSCAKYSLIYSQCGLWKEAEELQLQVWNFLRTLLGRDSHYTVRIQLALANTYLQLGKPQDAADLQEHALQISSKSYGMRHQTTLNIMDALGASRWMQGRYKEALKLHSDAIEGLTILHGSCHDSLARAKDHLGRVYCKYFRYEEAIQLHQEAITMFCETVGPSHLSTMEAMENLAGTYLYLGGSSLDIADREIRKVLELRKAKLGKEHPHTLLAMLTHARIKAGRGDLEEAEDDIRRGLLVAYRNMGADHIGVLCARLHLGDILYRRKRYLDADEELRDVIERQKRMSASQHNTHPDCIMGMYIRANCLRALSRYEEGATLCEEAAQALRDIGGHEHPFIAKFEERRLDIINAGMSVECT